MKQMQTTQLLQHLQPIKKVALLQKTLLTHQNAKLRVKPFLP
jgi:hypothetical protein